MCKFVFVFLHNYYFIVNQGDGEKKEGMELYVRKRIRKQKIWKGKNELDSRQEGDGRKGKERCCMERKKEKVNGKETEGMEEKGNKRKMKVKRLVDRKRMQKDRQGQARKGRANKRKKRCCGSKERGRKGKYYMLRNKQTGKGKAAEGKLMKEKNKKRYEKERKKGKKRKKKRAGKERMKEGKKKQTKKQRKKQIKKEKEGKVLRCDLQFQSQFMRG